MSHAFVTLAIPLIRGAAPRVRAALERLGNPIGENLEGTGLLPEGQTLKKALDRAEKIHFIAGAIAPGLPGEDDYLIFEMTADGTKDSTLALFAEGQPLGDGLADVLEAAGVIGDLPEALKAYSLQTGSGLRDLPGLNFAGTPGMTVSRIREEARLSNALRDHLAGEFHGYEDLTARARLDDLKARIQNEDDFKEVRDTISTTLPVPLLVEQKISGLSAGLAMRLAFGASKHLLWPLILAALVIAVVRTLPVFYGIETAFASDPLAWAAGIWGVVWRTIVWTIILTVVVWVAVLRSLSRREKGEHPDDSAPDAARLADVRRREDRQGLQNHLFGVSRMKPGFLRGLLLRFAFWLITFAATHAYRPGHLKDIGTIHFARWAQIPGTRTLLFCSNYGGSWESYLEDFITKAPNGLTAVWSNTLGFPKARFLFGDGARNSDPFKRWARRQQHPTLLWYSAYPDLTTSRIRANAAVRNGLVSAVTEDECRAVLSLLGSRPPPAAALEKDEIQSIILTGMSRHKQSVVSLLRLPDDPEDARSWLRGAMRHLGLGERPGGSRIDQIAFSARGLERMGQAELVEDFPFVFKAGMASRAAALGDTGDDAPQRWSWGNDEDAADVLLVSYLADPNPPIQPVDGQPGAEDDPIPRIAEYARKTAAEIEKAITDHHGAVIASVTTLHLDDKSRRSDNQLHAREFFGFADGVSQPRIRGLRPYRLIEDDQHILSPGEFLLGYPDDRGQRAVAARVPASADPNHLLPVAGADHGRAKQPDLAKSGINETRDFSRNGSFLVVRQLAQDVTAFNQTLNAAAQRFARHPGMPNDLQGDPAIHDNPDLDQLNTREAIIARRRKHYIGAKMVGRWRDGSSLISYPNSPASGWCDPLDPPHSTAKTGDNGFLFGRDDPGGLSCPFGAHARRTNPRDSLNPETPKQVDITNRHRILRRGRFFATTTQDDTRLNRGRDEGLMFICANSDIERQFEFVQQTWIMAPQFHGLDNEVDPLFARSPEHLRKLGESEMDQPKVYGRYTIPTPQGPMIMTGIHDCIRVVGGGYFFLPSRAALSFLIDGAAEPGNGD